MNPTKILEISGNDWMKGNSVHAGLPIGGIFQSGGPFDPFILPGYLRGSIAPTDVDTTTLSTEINSLASGSSNGVGYVVAFGNRASGGAKCAYLIATATNTVTDMKANVDSSLLLGGCFIYGDYVIYGDGTDGHIKSVVLPGFSSDTLIEAPANFQVANQPPVFAVGPSGYLHYFRGVANGQVGVITVPSSNHANNTEDSVIIPTALTPKDGCTDGRYFIIIGDDNPGRATGINADCRIFFTVPAFTAGAPVSTTTWEIAYQIPDQYLIAVRYVAGRVLVWGYSGIWECGIGMAPQLVFPLLSTQIPKNPYYVTVQKNIAYWAGVGTGAQVYGFGHLFGGKPIFFNPYKSTSSTQLHTALVSSGEYLYAGLDPTGGATTKVVAHNYGATRENPTIQSVVTHLPQPYKLSCIKVVLKKPLATGEAVNVSLFNANDEEIMTTSTRSYTSFNGLRTLKFDPAPGSSPINTFDNFYVVVNPEGGAIVETVQVWGHPESPLEQRA